MLRTIRAGGHEISRVVTAPPKPAGRGRKLVPSPVEAAALELGLPVLAPDDPHEPQNLDALRRSAPELAVLVAYGWILRRELLELPKLGFVNVHPSLLPAYRGAAPVQRAIIDGRTQTGVSVIKMKRTVDAGDVVAQQATEIGSDETAAELSSRLADIAGRLVLEALDRIADGTIRAKKQDPAQATNAPKLTDEERWLDWSQTSAALHNRIRALSPKPAAATLHRGRNLLIYRSRLTDAGRPAAPGVQPGTFLLEYPGLLVATGDSALELVEVKPEGSRLQSGQSFRSGHRLEPGERLGGKPVKRP